MVSPRVICIGDRQLLNRDLFDRSEPQQEIARVDLRRARRDGRWIGRVAGCDHASYAT
jgi:hypothetical protein